MRTRVLVQLPPLAIFQSTRKRAARERESERARGGRGKRETKLTYRITCDFNESETVLEEGEDGVPVL